MRSVVRVANDFVSFRHRGVRFGVAPEVRSCLRLGGGDLIGGRSAEVIPHGVAIPARVILLDACGLGRSEAVGEGGDSPHQSDGEDDGEDEAGAVHVHSFMG